jgi:hypothetical protein
LQTFNFFLEFGSPANINEDIYNFSNFHEKSVSAVRDEEIGVPCLSSTLDDKSATSSSLSLSQAISISLALEENGLEDQQGAFVSGKQFKYFIYF